RGGLRTADCLLSFHAQRSEPRPLASSVEPLSHLGTNDVRSGPTALVGRALAVSSTDDSSPSLRPARRPVFRSWCSADVLAFRSQTEKSTRRSRFGSTGPRGDSFRNPGGGCLH